MLLIREMNHFSGPGNMLIPAESSQWLIKKWCHPRATIRQKITHFSVRTFYLLNDTSQDRLKNSWQLMKLPSSRKNTESNAWKPCLYSLPWVTYINRSSFNWFSFIKLLLLSRFCSLLYHASSLPRHLPFCQKKLKDSSDILRSR